MNESSRRGTKSLTLVANGELHSEGAFGYLQRHAIPGVERMDPDGRRLTRLLRMADGMVISVDITLRADGLQLMLPETAAEHAAELIGRLRRWFDLDADLAAIGEVLDRDPALAAVGCRNPGMRIIGYPDGFEGAIATVLGQQVSLAAARTFAGRLARAYGTPGPAGLTLFPTPERLAAVPVEALRAAIGVPNARAGTLRALAELFSGGFRLEPAPPDACSSTGPLLSWSKGSGPAASSAPLTGPLLSWSKESGPAASSAPSTRPLILSKGSGHAAPTTSRHVAEARAALLALPGIGPWTVEYLAMRAMHDEDACPAGDLVLRRALGVDRAQEVLARAERWRPYRAYAVVRLWAAALDRL